jgi:SET domain-containing protein
MKKKQVMEPPVYVAKSSIHGNGLFAARDIKKGELIGCFKYRRAKKDGPYVLWLAEDEGYTVLDDFKYINHNNRANAAYYDDFTVMAIKKIKKGEEITHYYGEDWAR